jgi:hypothetical protein
VRAVDRIFVQTELGRSSNNSVFVSNGLFSPASAMIALQALAGISEMELQSVQPGSSIKWLLRKNG